LGTALGSLAGDPLQPGQFPILGELGERVARPILRACIFAGFEKTIDLFHPSRFDLIASLILAASPQPLDLEIQAGVLSVNVTQNVPLAECIGVLALLFELPRLGEDRVDQIPPLADQPQ
jgi:hypothetical protein